MSNKNFNFNQAISIILVLPLVFIHCKGSKKVSEGLVEAKQDIIISQSKLKCMGMCPVYDIQITADGSVIYHGKENVPFVGKKEFKLNNQDFKSLLDRFEKIRFFELKDKYVADISDGATTYVYFKQGEKEKKILDYHGTPKKLKLLEEYLEEIIYSYLDKE